MHNADFTGSTDSADRLDEDLVDGASDLIVTPEFSGAWSQLPGVLHPTLRKGTKDGAPGAFWSGLCGRVFGV